MGRLLGAMVCCIGTEVFPGKAAWLFCTKFCCCCEEESGSDVRLDVRDEIEDNNHTTIRKAAVYTYLILLLLLLL